MFARLIAVALGASLARFGRASPPDEKLLNIYNWSDYIAADTVPRFEKETGIKVNYDVYDSNEVLEAKLLAGHSGYDLVVPSARPISRARSQAGVYRRSTRRSSRITAISIRRSWPPPPMPIPATSIGVPYLWGTTGIGYNPAMVEGGARRRRADRQPRRCSSIPANAKKLADCGISLLDSAQEMFPAALAYLGRDPLSRDPADLERAVGGGHGDPPLYPQIPFLAIHQRPRQRRSLRRLGLFGRRRPGAQPRADAKNGVVSPIPIPKEGAMIWIDMMAIPEDAPHPGERAALHRLHPAARRRSPRSATRSPMPIPTSRATELVDPTLRNDPNIYPPPTVRARLFFDKPVTPQYERLRTRAWTRVKTGE